MLQALLYFSKYIFRGILVLLGILTGVSGLLLLLSELIARSRIYRIDTVANYTVAIVFGAGLRQDGTPTIVLRDRVATAADLYFSGKVKKLLMSGDNLFAYYNEPGAMSAYAITLGVSEKDIVLDYAGRRTYDTCYRAKHIFGVSEAIVVTQQYHLPRTLMICNSIGIKAAGVPADQRQYWPLTYMLWRLREVPATINALMDIWITKPLPLMGQPEPIMLTRDNNGRDHFLRDSGLD